MKILIVDDHPVLREGLAAILRQCGPETVILQAGTAQDGLGLLERHGDLDVVILDLIMPGMGGMLALTEFGKLRPELPVIVLSSSEEPHEARRALAMGALGYVPKSAGQHVLLTAIEMVLRGELYVPPLVLASGPAGPASPQARSAGRGKLTERQIEVLRLLSTGEPNKVIAHQLDLSEKTVKAHITAIFRTLSVVNRTQAAAVGRQLGLI